MRDFLSILEFLMELPNLAYRFLGATLMATVCIHVFCGIPLIVKTKKDDDCKEPSRYNNRHGNTDLADNLINSAIILGFLVFLVSALNDWKNQVVVITCLGYTIPTFLITVILPAKIIITKREIITYYVFHTKKCSPLSE